jgi:hypothetical protein
MTHPAHTLDADRPSTVPAVQAGEAPISGARLMDAAAANALPTSFGAFKPVGHLMVGLPTQVQLNRLETALRDAGWPHSDIRQFSPQESVAEFQAMVDKAGILASFGFEIVLTRRYLSLTEAGYHWLLVQAEDTERATAAAQLARECGATQANYYRTLTVEELI